MSKEVVLVLLSLLTAYLFSRTVERSLKVRGLPPEKVKFYKLLSLLGMFLFLLLLSFF